MNEKTKAAIVGKQSPEQVEQMLRQCGTDTANFWLDAACKNKEPSLISNQIEVLKYAAVHILASYAFNASRAECCDNPKPSVHTIMDLKGEIEDRCDEMTKDLGTNKMDFQDLNKGPGHVE